MSLKISAASSIVNQVFWVFLNLLATCGIFIQRCRMETKKLKLAYDIFIDRLQKYIGQYLAVLNGADAIIFTAGIGENAVNVRSSIINGISWFGCKVDPEKNVFGVVGDISTDDSRVKVLVIPTDEELVIARDVERFKNQ